MAREGSHSDREAMARRVESCGFNGHQAFIQGKEAPSKDATQYIYGTPSKEALDYIRPIAATNTEKAIQKYRRDGSVDNQIKRYMVLLKQVSTGNQQARSTYVSVQKKAMSGKNVQAMNVWADMYVAAQLLKITDPSF